LPPRGHRIQAHGRSEPNPYVKV
jgi:hypothetical protein